MLTALYPGRPPRTADVAADRDTAADTYLQAVMLLTLSYHLWLCFINTHLGMGGNRLVVLAELAMVAACLPVLLKRLPLGTCLMAVLLLINGIALALVRGDFDLKPLRDILVPHVFLWVGLNSAGADAADRLLRRAVWLVLAFAVFEFFFLDLFTRLFDVYSYYVARGVADPNMSMYRDDRLVASGMRPEEIGRTILPFLGAHRASSVFIEPVSLGNFAVICAAWGLARERWRDGAFFLAAAATMLVLCDSRFGLVAIALLVVLRLVLVRDSEAVGIAFPFICAAALAAIALAARGIQYTDDFLGRLSRTGEILLDMEMREFLGARADIPSYFDMGYPYVLANFGLFMALLVWGAFWTLPMATRAARRFRVFVALYLSLILCVSGTSVFAFKTSAILWFLVGSLAARHLSARAGRGAAQHGG